MNKKTIIMTVIASILIAGIAATAFFTTLLQPISVTPTVSGPQRVSEVRIGVLTPLTGPAAYFGEGQKAMAELMAKKINEEGGIRSLGGAKVRVIVADTEGKPEVGKIQAERLIVEEKVHLIIGALHSGVTSAASIEAERYGIPWICETSSHPDLTRRGFKWFFRIWGHDEIFAKEYFLLLRWLQEKTGIKINTIAFIAEETLFAVGVAHAWEKYNLDPNLGGYKVVANIRHPSGVSDLTSEALTLKAANPDVVFMVNTPIPDAILWTKTLKQVGFFPKALMTTGGFTFPAYLEAVGMDGEYIIGRGGWSLDLTSVKPKAKEVYEWYTRETGKDMHIYVMTMHAAMVLVRDVLERAGSVEPEKIRQALIETDLSGDEIMNPWKGIKFDGTGQNIYPIDLMVQVIDGKFRMIWPSGFQAVEPIFPAPSWEERK